MYPSRGNNSYAQQQSYAAQSSYSHNPASAYPGSSGAPEGGSQLNIASRHPSILGGRYEADIGAYRAPSSASNYGGQYSSLYASASASAIAAKTSGPSGLDARGVYISARPESPKYTPAEYVVSSSHGYGQNSERLLVEKLPEYLPVERRQYGERQSVYLGRDLPAEIAGRYADSISHSHQHQPNLYDRIDQSVVRQDQMLKNQSLQPTSHDGLVRQADYLAARTGTLRAKVQELEPYGGRVDADPRGLSSGRRASLGGQNAPSILGAAPQRNVDDMIYAQTTSNPGYGVSLPPGRDYSSRKGLQDSTLDLDYTGSISARSLRPRIEDLKDERGAYSRQHESREDERQKERLREREKERERERERELERDRDRERERERREREREREKDREREHERGRERDRERERKRALELWEERERERKRGLETRRERSPPRVSRDRHTSVTKDGKLTRQDSPRREASHRLHSPAKEKRRDYVCKVHTSSLVVSERDYLSLDKRYPRLYISPDFCKLLINWPKEELKLSMHTPVRQVALCVLFCFEHDFIEEGGIEKKDESIKPVDMETVKHKSVVWNVKMILMSGLSRSALEELSSDKVRDDRIPHICSFLRFAVLRKERAFMAIGGPWDPVDGGDPAVDDSSLVRTVIRYAKDVTQLDLQNCKHWNRFLEIHYDRIGEDGLFSHKEVTVLFVPDLSNCLPSLDAWKEQWLSHKKAVAERERKLSLKKESSQKSKEKKDSIKDGESNSQKDDKQIDKSGKKETVPDIKKEKDVVSPEVKSTDHGKEGTAKNAVDIAGALENVKKTVEGDTVNPETVKTGKKKIVKRIIRHKVPVKKGMVEAEKIDKMDKDAIPVNVTSENAAQKDISAEPAGVKTFVRKKVVNTVSQAEPATDQPQDDKQQISAQDKSQVKLGTVGVKRTIKRTIIRRVRRKKTSGAGANSTTTTYDDGDGKVLDAGNGTENVDGDKMDEDVKTGEVPKMEKDLVSQALSAMGNESSSKTVNKADKVAKREGTNEKKAEASKGTKPQKGNGEDTKEKRKERETSRDGKEENDKGLKDGPKSKSSSERKKPEEPPRPGVILQTKAGTDSKAVRSLSLSLDSLLDYSDKDFEESTFELSLFAESMYEMFQYQMGHRLLTFLQKLRRKFVMKRNRRKRQRQAASEKKMQDKTSTKHPKCDQNPGESKSTKSEKADGQPDGKSPEVKEEKAEVGQEENVKQESEDSKMPEVNEAKDEIKVEEPEEESEEDPEEEPEEDPEEVPEEVPQEDENDDKEDAGSDAKPEDHLGEDDGKGTNDESANGKASEKDSEKKLSPSASQPEIDGEKAIKNKEVKAEAPTKAEPARKEPAVDKELLQAFRFFDRNRAGYVRVEDLRLILHSLGENLSHRDVKELAQSALLESNTGRDDRILYEKLVKMTDLH
ncbi:SHORT ROOT IN SALT MEDIUM 1-like protein [Drosera capensis]